MANFITEPFPSRDAIVNPQTGKASDVFVRWNEEGLLRRLQSTPVLPDVAEVLRNRSAAASGTIGGLQSSGLYALNGYMQILTPAGVANSLQLTIGWTFNGVSFTEVFAALTSIVLGNAGTRQPQVFSLWIDPNTAVSYSFAYASNPAAAMVWTAALGLTLLQPIGD